MKELRQNPSRLTDREVINLQLGSGSLVVESFKLLLLPVWLAHYKVEGQVYDVMINGQSGAAHGTKPEGIVGKISSWLREK
jgi:hypothetical protein